MNRRILSASLLIASAGCATTQGADHKSGETSQKERLVNRSEFNVATCQATPVEPVVSTEATVVGALLNGRPLINECLVDPKSRGPEKETSVVVDTTVTEEGAKHQVTGTNLTPEGTQCVEAALAKTVKLPALEKGAQPVKGQVQVVHVAGVSPTVTWGVNEPSDIVGTIRLAQPGWCDCYAGYKDGAPSTVKAWFKVLKGTTSISQVEWVSLTDTKPPADLLHAKPADAKAADAKPAQAAAPGTQSPEEQQLTQCLSAKLQGLQLPAAPNEDKVLPYTFEFIHSAGEKTAANATPELAFRHLDALRATEQALSATASGVWTAALNKFNDLAVRYNKRDKKVTYNQVKEQCSARAKAAEAWLAQMDKQLTVEKRLVELATQQAAKNEGWQDVVKKASEEATKTEADRAEVQKQRDADVAACKKLI